MCGRTQAGTALLFLDKGLCTLRGGAERGRRTGRRWAHISRGCSRFRSPLAQICPGQGQGRLCCRAPRQRLSSAGKAGLCPGRRDDPSHRMDPQERAQSPCARLLPCGSVDSKSGWGWNFFLSSHLRACSPGQSKADTEMPTLPGNPLPASVLPAAQRPSPPK